MIRFRTNIMRCIILLLSWSIFVSPALSFALTTQTSHTEMMQSIPCQNNDCSMMPANQCFQHCENLTVITTQFSDKILPTQSIPTLVTINPTVQQLYIPLELKPPI